MLEEGESRVMSDDRAAMIEQTCVPVMREALMDMFRGVERFHMDTVAGTNLEDGYLPRHFKHFNPLKHLGKWLNARSRVKLVSGLTQNVALSKLSMREVHMSGLASEQSSDAGGGASLPALFDALSNTGPRNGKAPLDAGDFSAVPAAGRARARAAGACRPTAIPPHCTTQSSRS